MDPNGKRLGIPDPKTVASVNMLEQLPGYIRELYSNK